MPRSLIIRRHVLHNCISPVITLAGLDIAIFLSGVVFVEQVFSWPGIGSLQEESFRELDRPVLMGTVIIGAVVVVVLNPHDDRARALFAGARCGPGVSPASEVRRGDHRHPAPPGSVCGRAC